MGTEAIEVDFDGGISDETDIPVPREPLGVSPVTMTVVVIMGAMEWAVLRLEIPVFWVMEDGGMRLVWVCNRLECEWVEVVDVMADVPVLKMVGIPSLGRDDVREVSVSR